MQSMIENQIFAPDMESLMSQMKHFLQERLVTILSALWYQVCHETIYRKTIEFTFHHGGMEFTIAELRVSFYFFKDKKFWRQMQSVLKLNVSEYWMNNVIIQQTFLSDWCMEPFTPWCIKN